MLYLFVSFLATEGWELKRNGPQTGFVFVDCICRSSEDTTFAPLSRSTICFTQALFWPVILDTVHRRGAIWILEQGEFSSLLYLIPL